MLGVWTIPILGLRVRIQGFEDWAWGFRIKVFRLRVGSLRSRLRVQGLGLSV